MSAINIYLILVAVVNFILAFIIYFRSPDRRINIFFSLSVFSVTFWTACMLILRTVGQTNIGSLYLWSILLWVATVPIVLFCLYFCIEFPEGIASKRKRWLTRLMLLIPAAFVLVVNILYFGAFKNVFIIDGGVGYTLNLTHFCIWALYIVGYFTASFVILFRKLKNAKDIIRVQLIYIIYGILPAALFGVIFGIVFPLFDSYKYFWLSEGASIIMNVLIAYAIFKHHLFNIRVIATELLTFSIWVFLFIKTLVSVNYNDFLLNGVIFIAVVIAGILLIRSAIKEVEQKEKIEKIEKEIEKAYEVEKRANEELKNLDRVRNQFLVQTQHDLRTPLTAIKGYCELLLDGTFGKQPKRTIDVIKRVQTTTENKIKDVNNFLDITQFQLGKKVVALKSGVELNTILSEIIADLSANAKAKGISLDLKKTAEKFVVSADREKLKSAIYNIVDNSIKYTAKGGVKIAINPKSQTPMTKNDILITIKDTGIGIPKEKVKTLFESAFERSDEAKKASPTGRGVGLYLSGQIIKAHNGRVWAESEGEGKGSTFFIELPI